MKKSQSRVQSILAISFSLLVVLICIGASALMWALGSTTSSTVVQLLNATDKTVQIMRDGILKVDTKVEKLEESVGSVEDASAQLSQNVNDEGLVLVLLPTTKEQELTSAAQSVRDDFAAIRDYLDAAQETVQAINRLPFIALPDLAPAGQLQTQVTTMNAQVEELKTGIGEARSQTAANISKITEATANLNNQLAGLRSDLAATDEEFDMIQTHVRQLRNLVSITLLLIGMVVTLMAIWIVYSQFVMINRSLRRIRTVDNMSDEAGQNDSTQTGVRE